MIFKKFTFWLSLLSILICIFDFLGSNLANIILIRLNPVIDSLKFNAWIQDVHNTKHITESAYIPLRFPAYLIHFGTFFLVGLILDYIILLLKRWSIKQ
jgi:hypothetical protein